MNLPEPKPDDAPAGADAAPVALPDRLSVDPRSPFHDAELLQREITVTVNGRERFDVEEYCISEGWVKVPAARTLDRRGQPVLIKLKGKVEVGLR